MSDAPGTTDQVKRKGKERLTSPEGWTSREAILTRRGGKGRGAPLDRGGASWIGRRGRYRHSKKI